MQNKDQPEKGISEHLFTESPIRCNNSCAQTFNFVANNESMDELMINLKRGHR